MKRALPYYHQELTQPEMDAARHKAIEWMNKHWTTIYLLVSASRLR